MLTEPTIEKLKGMRLDALAVAWLEQQKKPDVAKLSFDERFSLLVDAEWLYRENKRLGRCLKEAKLRLSHACVEDIDYPARRELDRAVIRQLAACRWVDEHHNIVVTGATGTGKTYLACALAHQACRKGHRAIYRRASRLADELTLARADGTYVRALARLARVEVLVIDDWGHAPIRDQERRDQPAPGRQVARPHRRPNQCRRDLRPRAPQRPPDRAKGPIPTEGGLQGVTATSSSVASLRSR
jgi:DNA replication protein DnaC